MIKFKANVLTLFPEVFPGYLSHSNAGKALERGNWNLNVVNIRDFALDKHKRVDDTPFGGGAGMLLKCDVLGRALESVVGEGFVSQNNGVEDKAEGRIQSEKQKVYYFSPRGKVLNQRLVEEISKQEEATFVCGHYEGVDQRFLDYYEVEEISIGDYILSGGELPCQVLLDSVVRLLDGVIDSEVSHQEESFGIADGNLLEYPHYTRPVEWNGMGVPEVLRSGHHKKIQDWQLDEAEKITKSNRPDLWNKYKKIDK